MGTFGHDKIGEFRGVVVVLFQKTDRTALEGPQCVHDLVNVHIDLDSETGYELVLRIQVHADQEQFVSEGQYLLEIGNELLPSVFGREEHEFVDQGNDFDDGPVQQKTGANEPPDRVRASHKHVVVEIVRLHPVHELELYGGILHEKAKDPFQDNLLMMFEEVQKEELEVGGMNASGRWVHLHQQLDIGDRPELREIQLLGMDQKVPLGLEVGVIPLNVCEEQLTQT